MSSPTELAPLSGLTALVIAATSFTFCISVVNSLVEDIKRPLNQPSRKLCRKLKDIPRDDTLAFLTIITFLSSLFVRIATPRAHRWQDPNHNSTCNIAHILLITIPPASHSPQLPYTARLIITWKWQLLSFVQPKGQEQQQRFDARRTPQSKGSSGGRAPSRIPTRTSLGFERRMKAVRPDRDSDTAMFRWAESCLDERVMLSSVALDPGVSGK